MNLQTQHLSGQGGGGAAVPVMNGSNSDNNNSISGQMQTSGGGHINMEPDYVNARRFMTTKMLAFILFLSAIIYLFMCI